METVIALVGGGTAGHIMPNLALVTELKKHFNKVIYLGSKESMEEELCKKQKIPYYSTKTVKFARGKILKNLAIPFKLFAGIHSAKKILKKQNVSVVFSKGGFASLPTVIAATLLGIPIACHESDRTLGLANKIATRLGDKTYTAFPDTCKNGLVVPTPIREEIFKGKKLDFFKNNKPVLLFMGGSLGAESINKVLIAALPTLTKDFNILHLAGKKYTSYRTENYVREPFTNNIEDWFATADLVVCRAGASTLGELTALGKRIIAIPLPKGVSRGDQEQNAAYYLKRGAVKVLPEFSLSVRSLVDACKSNIMIRPPAPTYDRQIPKLLSEELYSLATMKT